MSKVPIFTSIFVLVAPLLVLAANFAIGQLYGSEATITCVIRGWAKHSKVPEIIFLVCALLLYLHLFRGLDFNGD